jgi:macrolide-specific efflux system membrane fusion protein
MPKLPFLTARRALVLAVIAGAAGAWFAWVTIWGAEKPPELTTAEVSRGDLEVTISSAGKIRPRDSVAVGAQVSGQLRQLLVEPGDEVERGQLLARIDATIAETNVEASRAQLRELEASRKQQQAALDLSRANFGRAKMLYDNDAIARAEFEAAEAEYKVAEGRLEAINAQISRQASTLRAQQATLEFTNIYAPISGTVVSVAAVEGQTLNAAQTAPTILTLADLSVMTVETDVSEADVLRILPGQEAWFTTLGDGTRRWPSVVRQVLPTPEVLNDVVLYKALLDVDNPESRLKPQMTAQVFFLTGAARDAVLVPVTALQSAPRGRGGPGRREGADRSPGQVGAGEPPGAAGAGADLPRREAMRAAREARPDAEMSMVLIMQPDAAPRPQPVLVGLRTRTQAEIIYGLEPGQVVVTGEVAAARPPAGQQQGGQRGGGMGGPPPGVRRG